MHISQVCIELKMSKTEKSTDILFCQLCEVLINVKSEKKESLQRNKMYSWEPETLKYLQKKRDIVNFSCYIIN